jgi:DNA-directed RNA polymerase specialized sigma24 family protein
LTAARCASTSDIMCSTTQSDEGKGGSFPETLWSVVVQAAQKEDPEAAEKALQRLCVLYREPVRSWLLKTGKSPDQVDDLTQGFMEFLLARNRLRDFERGTAKFRSFLLECLKRYVRGEWRKQQAEKRGAGVEHLDIDDAQVGSVPEIDKVLDLQFALAAHHQAMLALATGKYASEPKRSRLQALRGFIWGDDERSYADVGRSLGMTANHVKKAVFDLRHHHFEAFRHAVAQTVTPGLVDEETRYLFTLLAGSRDAWASAQEPPGVP